MTSVNGALSALSEDQVNASPTQSIKRKREDSIGGLTNGKSEPHETMDSMMTGQTSESAVADFIEVLKQYDSTPSVLEHALPSRSSNDEPQAKRKKPDATENTTILSRAASGAYASIDEIAADVETLCASILIELQRALQAAPSHSTREGEQIMKIKSFRKKAADLLKSEQDFAKIRQHTNGMENTNNQDAKPFIAGDHKVVLTLYGNAQGPKQLFSSFQTSDSSQPLREIALPNGITTTQIVPLQATGPAEEKKRIQTLGELFPASSNTPALQPPKPSKVGSTRNNTLGWYQPSATDHSRTRSQTYFTQNISTGQWLGYSNSAESPDPKKKQRERALSLSGARPTQLENDHENAEQEAAKLDALFRSAYSGFAPSKDDSAAIAPVGQLNRIWWQRQGNKSFERLVENTLNMHATLTPEDDVMDEVDDTKSLDEPITDWVEPAIDPSLEQMGTSGKSFAEKDVDEVLEGISELIETLHSYQRNRNLSLSSQRTAGSLSTADSTTTPSKPTESETATYNILKSQLALMIAGLPPYAVAKLDSDQLEELAISTKIPVYLDDYKGVMEEDEASARAKIAAMSAASTRASGSAPLHRSSSSLYGNQYASPARTAVPNNYYPATRTPVRPSPGPLPRPPATAPAPYGQRASPQTAYRPTPQGYGTPTYPHQQAPSRTSQTPYGQSNAHQYFQSPAPQPYTSTYSQQYHASPQAGQSPALNAARYQQNQGVYSSQSSLSSGTPTYGFSNGATPQHKISPYAQQSGQSLTQSRPMGTPQHGLTADRRYFQQTHTQNSTPQHIPKPQSPMQGIVGATGYHTVMTPAEQASMMERQRAQLAQQQGVQMQARAAAQAQAGTINGAPS